MELLLIVLDSWWIAFSISNCLNHAINTEFDLPRNRIYTVLNWIVLKTKSRIIFVNLYSHVSNSFVDSSPSPTMQNVKLTSLCLVWTHKIVQKNTRKRVWQINKIWRNWVVYSITHFFYNTSITSIFFYIYQSLKTFLSHIFVGYAKKKGIHVCCENTLFLTYVYA